MRAIDTIQEATLVHLSMKNRVIVAGRLATLRFAQSC
jgi:hypothetical protein